MAQLTPQFFATILKMEGGYQNRPDDTGNYSCGVLAGTNMGVSAVALGTWLERCVSADDVRNLTRDEAFEFYAWYFDRYNLFEIEDQHFAELLMNNTMGSPAGAAKSEQRALNAMGYQLAVDGQRGPKTIAALNEAWKRDPSAIYNGVRSQWIQYLHNINKPQFIDGWLYRMNRFFPPLTIKTASFAGIGLALTLIYLVWKR